MCHQQLLGGGARGCGDAEHVGAGGQRAEVESDMVGSDGTEMPPADGIARNVVDDNGMYLAVHADGYLSISWVG